MNQKEEFSDYKLLGLVLGIIAFAVYIWIESIGWQIVLNQSIKYGLLIIGVAILMFLIGYSIQNNKYNKKGFKLNKTILIFNFLIAIILIILSLFDIDYMNLDFNILLQKVYSFIQSIMFIIIPVICLVIVSIIVFNILKARKRKYHVFLEEIHKLSKKPCNTTEEVDILKNKIKQLIESNKRFAEKAKEEIDEVLSNLKERRKYIVNKDSEYRREEELKKIQYEGYKKKVDKLLTFFIAKDSTQSIPKWAINFSKDIIEESNEKFYEGLREKREKEMKVEKIKKFEEEATAFVLKHRALPSNYHDLSEEEKSFYNKAYNKFEKGLLEPRIEVEPKDKELVKINFFLSKDLSEEQKEKFVSKYGYRKQVFTHLDGNPGNHLIIKNNSKTESDYHFCMKHLIARIDDISSFIEYSIKGMRADVVFKYKDKMMAVEIEKGTNNEKQVKKKVEWLNKHFDYWIIISPRGEQKNYRRYVNKKKSFCLGTKKAKEKITEFMSQHDM